MKGGRRSMAFAGRVRPKHMLMILVLCMVIGWPLYQLMDLRSGHSVQRDAAKLLHEVALFQLEMLVGSLEEAGLAEHAAQLEPLMRQLYAFQYVHGRLEQLYGSDRLGMLSAPKELLQVATELQLRARPLKGAERELFTESARSMAEMIAVYERLVRGRKGISSQHLEQLRKMDQKLVERIQSATNGIR